MILNSSKFNSLNKLNYTFRGNFAFTLIELLVVIAIIGILSALIIVGMNSTTQKATVAKAQVFSNSLRNSLMGNLVSEWKLDGNANDTWGGQNGSLVGSPALQTTVNCVSGACYSFNGSSQYVSIPHPVGTDVFNFGSKMTVFIWIKGGAQGSAVVLGHYDYFVNKRAWVITASDISPFNQMLVALSDTGVWGGGHNKAFRTDSIVFDGNWHLIGFTWSSGVLKLYIDGREATVSMFANDPITSIYNSDLAINIGSDLINGSPSHYFTGLIDEARIYNETIPTSQIQQMYFVGINKLFTKNQITQSDYHQRLVALSNNYAKE